MRVILLAPYYSFTGDTYVFHRASIPYNLMSIEAYLKLRGGIRSTIYNLASFNESEVIRTPDNIRCGAPDYSIIDIIKKENPAIVGISAMFSTFHHDIVSLTKLIHSVNPLIRVVVGGNHASCFPERLLKDGVDQVVVGEGEEAFLSICQGNTDRIVKFPYAKDLDTLPVSVLPLRTLNKYISVRNPATIGRRVTGIISSRGCPNNCIYCTVSGVWGHTWRGRGVMSVVDEMQHYVDYCGVDEFHFLDDNVSVDKARWEGILDEIIRRGLNKRMCWACPMAYWTIDERILGKMKVAGCYRLSFGIESGDPETRKFIGKNYPLSRAKEIIWYANKIGLWTITTNIIGFPYETREQIQNTIDFAKECETDFACFFNLIPHAQSRVYPYFIKENLIREGSDIMAIMNEGGCGTVHFKAVELKALQKQAYSEFIRHKIKFYLTHPWAILRKIRSVRDLRYMVRIITLGVSMARRSLSAKVSPTSKDFIYGKRQYV